MRGASHGFFEMGSSRPEAGQVRSSQLRCRAAPGDKLRVTRGCGGGSGEELSTDAVACLSTRCLDPMEKRNRKRIAGQPTEKADSPVSDS